MKVIDLLNKIANGEDIPQLIKWNGYVYDKLGCEYYMLNDRDITLFGDILDTDGKYLNEEIEIIEDEPRDIEVCGSLFTKSEYNRLAGIKEDKKIETLELEPLDMRNDFQRQIELVHYENIIIAKKINEIIDKMNKEK